MTIIRRKKAIQTKKMWRVICHRSRLTSIGSRKWTANPIANKKKTISWTLDGKHVRGYKLMKSNCKQNLPTHVTLFVSKIMSKVFLYTNIGNWTSCTTKIKQSLCEKGCVSCNSGAFTFIIREHSSKWHVGTMKRLSFWFVYSLLMVS